MNRMIKTSLSASLLALFVASTAGAADLGRNTSDPTSAEYVAPDTVSFTGFYVGGRIGYGNANHDLTVNQYNGDYCFNAANAGGAAVAPTDATNPFPEANWQWVNGKKVKIPFGVATLPTGGECSALDVGTYKFANVAPSDKDVYNLDGLNSHGIIGGFQAGYDQQVGRFVIGVFGTYDFSGMETTGDIGGISNPDGISYDVTSIEKGDEWSVGARAGILVNPKTLVYLLAAYTQTEYDFKGTDQDDDAFTKSTTFDGVSVGGGVEFALTQNVFLGLEYVHTFYGEETVLDTSPSEVGGFGQKIIDDLDEDKVMATLKVKLNSGLGF